MTLFVGCTSMKMTTASSLRTLVSTVYSSGSEFHTFSEPTMMTMLSNPIRFHASAVKGSMKVKPRDTAFPGEVVENTAYFRFGSIFPSIVGLVGNAIMSNAVCRTWLGRIAVSLNSGGGRQERNITPQKNPTVRVTNG